MSDKPETRFEVDLWNHREGDRTPARRELKLVCVHEVNVGIDSIREALHLRRLRDWTELWRLSDLNKEFDEYEHWTGEPSPTARRFDLTSEMRCIVTDHKPPRSNLAACRELLYVRIKAGVGHEWPNGFHGAGLLAEADHKGVIGRVEAEIEADKQAAERFRSSEIIQTAIRLGLDPEPTTWHPDSWWCNCPGTHHRLAIVASTGEFGCGYCCAKGGPKELKAFAAKRREPARAERQP